MHPPSRCRAALLAVGLALAFSPARVAIAAPTAADLETARTLYHDGLNLRASGDLKGALSKLKLADELVGTPITGVELGRTYEMLGQLLEARETFLAVARIPIAPKESPNAAAARAEAAQLEQALRPRIPSLVVHVTGVPAGAPLAVTIDGATILPDALAVPRKLDPGAHTIVVHLDGRADQTATRTLKEGESAEVTIDMPAASGMVTEVPKDTAKPPPKLAEDHAPPAATHERSTSALTYVGFGVAGVGVLVGTITGVVTMSRSSSLKDRCGGGQCPPSQFGDLDSTRTLGTASTISFVAAGAGAIVGVIGLLSSGESAAPAHGGITPWVSLSSVGVRGAF